MINKTAFAALALLLAACGPNTLEAKDAWARPTAMGGTAAVYMDLRNGTTEDLVLTGASSEVARVIEMHHSMAMDEMEGMIANEPDTDVMTMMPVAELSLGAGETIVFEPGGYHLMLIDLQQELVEGEMFIVTLHFSNSPDLQVEVQVIAR
jgi:copper(I)-binding protein